MRNTNVFKTTVCVLMSACILSCSLEKQDEPEKETYTKNFIEAFGAIDPNQDWNMATRDSVTVNTPELANVKVYVKDYDGEYSLVADYDSVSGPLTIGFDAARDVKEVLVASGRYSEIVPVGSTVDFTEFGTRTTYESDGTNTGGISVEKTSNTKTLSEKEVTAWSSRLPEGGSNESRVTSNFHASSADGNVTFTMYPIYWNTGNGVNTNGKTGKVGLPNEIGLAYKDASGTIVHVPIYRLMEGDELQGYNGRTHQWENIGKQFPSNQYTYKYYGSTKKANYSSFKSTGITVTVPQGLYFGFYILCYDGQDEVNDNVLYGYSIADWNEGNKSYVGTYTDNNGKTYLTFEDWITTTEEGATVDLNDFVMMFDPAPTILDDGEAGMWILAAEDLGDLDDYDFNNMVISVKHPAGKTYANITALAAGGTLPVQLYRNESPIGGEFHSWFDNGTISSSTMINTTLKNKTGNTVSITVPADFTMSSYGGIENMGGFKWVVTRKDGTTSTITAPQKGEAPQMMCLPSTWSWPKERVRIDTAYPDFGKWGENYTNGTWINHISSNDLVLPTPNN